MGPYREERDRLGEDAREYDAVEALGRWRMGLRARALVIGAVVGGLAGFLGFWCVGEVQFMVWSRNWILMSVAIGFATPFGAALGLALLASNRQIRARTPAQVDLLAERYRVDRARLDEIANLVGDL